MNREERDSTDSMEDEMIINLFCERSEQAISELSVKYGRLAQGVCENILGNSSDAEECVNDSLFTTWNSIPPSRPTSLKAYFVAIARNKAFDRYRYNTSSKRDAFGDVAIDDLEEYIGSVSTIESECEVEEITAALNRFLGKLKKNDRIIFVCKYYYSTPIDEIAKRLGVKESYVSLHLFRVREKLRKYLIKEKLI